MNGMQITKLTKKKKRLLVILNDYDTGYEISVVVLNQKFEVIEYVQDRISRQWFNDENNGEKWNHPAIVLYLAKKYGNEYEIIFKEFTDGAFDVDKE